MNYVSVLLICVICLTTHFEVELSGIFVNVYCTGMLFVIARRTCPSMSKRFTYLLIYLHCDGQTDRKYVYLRLQFCAEQNDVDMTAARAAVAWSNIQSIYTVVIDSHYYIPHSLRSRTHNGAWTAGVTKPFLRSETIIYSS